MAKSATDKTLPNLENATPGYLIDEIKKMRVEAARLKFLEGVYKQALEARASDEQLNGISMVEGEKNFGKRKKMTQERVDTDAVREYFKNDPEELAKVMKLIEFYQWDIIPKTGDV